MRRQASGTCCSPTSPATPASRPAVTVAHRLLKNTIRARIGFRPYLFVTDAAATALGLSQVGLAHREEYADAGQIQGRIVELGGPVREGVS